MLGFIWTLLVGLVVGALAKLVMPGRDPGGIFITMMLGVAGALVATFIGRVLGLYSPGQGAGFIMSTLGAILLLALYRMVKQRHAV
ncbi:MAG TPA: GlsB/YeaQ/YmgE family stress response membrane protein [Bryobacteraceae bacterium]|nr:GlsB/YeaQ/YmgE family stress response membrane protein [Bryobacteraceae bacterium]